MQTIQDIIFHVETYVRTGGIVMIPMIVISFIMWLLIINRALYLRRLYRKNMNRAQAGEFIKTNQMPDLQQFKGITVHFIQKFLRRRTGRTRDDKFILDETVLATVNALDNYLSFIGILAGIAPLLGLLGTITGMIKTFDVIFVFGTGNIKAMAGGISEALITTQTGLLVAIPGMYTCNFLMRRAENLKQRISSLGIFLKRYV